MMRFFSYLSFLIFILAIKGCSPSSQPTSSANIYDEDLSIYRPKAVGSVEETTSVQSADNQTIEYVEPIQHLQTEIDSVLRIKAARNKELGYLPGFTIQIYTGRNRDEANRAKRLAYDLLIDQEPKITYDQPMFRVKVGQYYTRLEAEKSFQLLRKSFRQALVLQERIPLE